MLLTQSLEASTLFSSVRVKTGDLFGMIEKEVTFSVPDTFLVYPQYVDIAYRQLENHFEQGALSANINSAKDSTISVGVRDYKPGDRFSWIDWKATARTNNIMTKEFEQQRSHNVMIFIDRTESPLFESVVTFTASIVRAVLKQNSPSIIRVYRKRTNYLPFRQWRYAVTTNPLSFSKSASRQCIPALPECRHGTKKNL